MSKVIRFIFLILLSVGVFGCSDNGQLPDNFLARNVNINGSEYQYRVFVPKGRDMNQKLPVMLYLHGSGVRGEDNISRLTLSLPP